MAPKSTISRVLFVLSGCFQICGTLAADWSKSHIYNPAWPPHAKFHTGQTISMAIVLAILGLYFAFRPKNPALGRSQKEDIWIAMLFLDVYWATQALAFLYPGTHWCDEGFCFDASFPPQWAVETVGIGLNTLAYVFEAWTLKSSGHEKLNGKKAL